MRALAAALLVLSTAAHAHEPSRAAYLANAGVLVARGETKVLFDAFYEDSYGEYLTVAPATRAAMMKGGAPFDGIDAVFVSHIHGDHFSAAPMIAYLRAQPAVVLFAPEQARRAILGAGVGADDPVMTRIRAVDLSPEDDARRLSVGDVGIDVVSVPHAGDLKDVQNYSWRVTLNDETTVVHFGDAGAVISNFERRKDHFASKEPDAAFPPYWWFAEDAGRTILDDYIGAKHVIGVHAPASTRGNGEKARAELGGDMFTEPGEMRALD
ncbi:MAG: MBL fold metallo-hydrolase [Parvularculaceae bacterium]|nr:MBL fold metallo-hydrolase [Parvularculaceae bacterium]